MKTCICVGVAFLFGIADAFFGLVFYIHGNKISLFGRDLYHFKFTRCHFEFWVFSTIRVLCISTRIFCSPHLGEKEIKIDRYGIGLLTTVFITYTIAKILAYTENIETYRDNDIWFWSSVSWCIVASLCFYSLWVLVLKDVRPIAIRNWKLIDLFNIEDSKPEEKGIGTGSDDSGEEEADPLINGGINTEQSERKYSAFARLILLSRHEFTFLLIGFVALLCGSTCKYL